MPTCPAALALFAALPLLSIAAAKAQPAPIAIDTAGLPPRTVLQRVPPRPIPDWVRDNWRIGHLPPAGWNMVEAFANSAYNVITVNALRKWDIAGPTASWYPPDEVKQADEYIRRLERIVHGAGAKLVLYIGPVQTPRICPEMVKAHPDWVRVAPDGKPDKEPNFGNLRSGYADWLLKQLEYVVREYKVDGYWLDGYAPVHLHTFDQATRDLYRKETGKDLPMPPGNNIGAYDPAHSPEHRAYLDWHLRHFVDFADRMRATIRNANPNAVLFANHSANRTWYYPSMYMGEYPAAFASAIDIPSVEQYWDVPGDPLYQQFVFAFMQGTTQDRGASVWIQPQSHGIVGVPSPVEIQLRGLECLPWGVRPEFVESAHREEYMALHAANLKARDTWLARSEPVPYIGVVASEQTRALYAQGALPVYFSHTLGAFRALYEKHLPIRVLDENDLEDADLKGVRVIVLPNVACLSDRSAEVIRRFVKAGGGLVASYETSLYDAAFQRRADFALADLFHAHYVKARPVQLREEALALRVAGTHPVVNDPHILAEQSTAWANPNGAPPASGPLYLVASGAEVTAAEGGEVAATFTCAGGGSGTGPFPAIVASTYGKGRVVYLAASVDKGMFFYPDGYMRQMLGNAVAWAANGDQPLVSVDGPLILGVTVRRQPAEKRIVVHLLNNASSWGQHSIYQKLAPLPEELSKAWGFPNQSELRGTWPVREEVIPLHDIRVTCRVPGVKRATQQPEGIDLPLRAVRGGVVVTVPRVEMHSMVVFE